MELATSRSARRSRRSPQFQSVPEADDLFLTLWPHRYDYLWAKPPDLEERPAWKTESRHPLSDRHIQQGDYLYGVRFGPTTRYCLLDVDKDSDYHPYKNTFAIERMLMALEDIGLVASVPVTSSDSGGLHLYLPFEQEQQSWVIALVISTLLTKAGFKLKPGQLEVFPNPRLYTGGTPSLYNGHRLPLQAGSCLLNKHWEQIHSNQATFVQRWRWSERRNDLNCKTIERILQQSQQQRYKNVTGSAQKFLDDLHTEVEQGWTGFGQTNRLLGRIAMREYIFGHVLRGGDHLTGQVLVDAIIEVACALPGYEEWCRHQHEIHQLAGYWARSIEAAPKYYPYDPSKQVARLAPQSELEPANNIVSFNQWQALNAEQRIKAAIDTLQVTNNLPLGVTARADAIIRIARCSKQTLNKHKKLWHPSEFAERTVLTLVEPETAPLEPALLKTLEPLPEAGVHPLHPNKFVLHPAAPSGQAERHLEDGGFGGFSTEQLSKAVSLAIEPYDADPKLEVLTTVRAGSLPTEQTVVAAPEDCNDKALPTSQTSLPMRSSPATVARTNASASNTQSQMERQRQRQAAKAAEMQAWLELGDPILEREAQEYFAAWSAKQSVDLPTDAKRESG